MTGEITLTGLVLPIGGVKEKVLAARRAGVKRVIHAEGESEGLTRVCLDDRSRSEMEFIFAERIEEVLEHALPGVAPRFQLMHV